MKMRTFLWLALAAILATSAPAQVYRDGVIVPEEVIVRDGVTSHGGFTASTGTVAASTATFTGALTAHGPVTMTTSTITVLAVGGTTYTFTATSGHTLTAGQVVNSSVSKSLQDFADGVTRSIPGVIFTQTATVTHANSTDETALSGTGVGTLTLPANFFVAGKTLRLTAMGTLGTHSSAGTGNLQWKLGSDAVAATGAETLVDSLSGNLWKSECIVTCRTTGGSGTTFSQGSMNISTTSTDGQFLEAPKGSTTVDTTGTLAISLTFDWGTQNAANTISCTNLIVEALN